MKILELDIRLVEGPLPAPGTPASLPAGNADIFVGRERRLPAGTGAVASAGVSSVLPSAGMPTTPAGKMPAFPAGRDAGAPGLGATGAVVVFDGIVRLQEEGRLLLALDYEAYEPMASRELERLARELAAKHGQGKAQVLAVRVWHSIGRVPVGACSFRLEVASAHRKEALAFMDEFIDEMKLEVPIWKTPVFA